jgi:hypothetical protein
LVKVLLTILIFFCFENHIKCSLPIFDSTKIRPQILNISNKLAKYKRVEGVFVGIVGTPSKIYQTGKKLRIRATREELIELTFHPSPIVRTYSFWGLAELKDTALFPILIDHINDTVQIETMFADFGERKKLCDFLLELVIPKYVFTADYLYPNKTLLAESEKSVLDSIVIFKENNLNYKGIALINIEPNINYYNRIRELAERENIYAIVALSKYRNPEDTLLIRNSIYFPKQTYSNFDVFYYTFLAFSHFPNVSFERFLFQIVDSMVTIKTDERKLKTFYKAIASFKNPDFLRYLNPSNVHLSYYAFLGMTDFADQIYDSLLFNIWDTKGFITISALQYLMIVDKNRSLELIVKTLELDNKYLEIPGLKFYFVSTNYKSTVNALLDTLLVHDSISALNLIEKKIIKSEYGELEFFCEKVRKFNNESIIEAILNRLQSDKENTFDGDEYWVLMEAILATNNPELEAKLLNALLTNDYAMKKKFRNKENIKESIELIKWALKNPKSIDEMSMEKYR